MDNEQGPGEPCSMLHGNLHERGTRGIMDTGINTCVCVCVCVAESLAVVLKVLSHC